MIACCWSQHTHMRFVAGSAPESKWEWHIVTRLSLSLAPNYSDPGKQFIVFHFLKRKLVAMNFKKNTKEHYALRTWGQLRVNSVYYRLQARFEQFRPDTHLKIGEYCFRWCWRYGIVKTGQCFIIGNKKKREKKITFSVNTYILRHTAKCTNVLCGRTHSSTGHYIHSR